MQKKVTLRSLAQELGIAPATVFRALTDHPNVTLSLRRKVLALAQKRGYQLPEHRTKLAAIIIPGYQLEGYSGLLLSPLLRELSEHGLHAEILSIHDSEILQDHIYDGVISIVWNEGLEKQWHEKYATPLVVLNAASNLREGIYRVASDEKQGMTLALDHLYTKGRRRIALVSPPLNNNPGAKLRTQLYQQFCSAHHLPCLPFYSGNMQKTAGEILKNHPDAVFSVCETHAPELLYHFLKKGLRIPEDIALLGLEHRGFTPFTIPPLTALEQDFKELAKQAVQLLLHRINGEPSEKEILVPYSFHLREST